MAYSRRVGRGHHRARCDLRGGGLVRALAGTSCGQASGAGTSAPAALEPSRAAAHRQRIAPPGHGHRARGPGRRRRVVLSRPLSAHALAAGVPVRAPARPHGGIHRPLRARARARPTLRASMDGPPPDPRHRRTPSRRRGAVDRFSRVTSTVPTSTWVAAQMRPRSRSPRRCARGHARTPARRTTSPGARRSVSVVIRGSVRRARARPRFRTPESRRRPASRWRW